MRKETGLEIHLFGAPKIVLNGKAVEGIRRKNRALLFYLAARVEPLSRDHLLNFFWPDHERATAQAILRTMIHDLRKQLGEYFHADDGTLSIAEQTVVDARRFSSASPAGPSQDPEELANRMALYKGDFLDGFSLADAPAFDDWAASERERYRLLAARGFAELARRREATRDYPGALDAMRQALAFNAFQEELQREVMRLLYLNGDRVGVIRQYETLRKMLDEEMGVPPMPETRELYDTLIGDSYTAALEPEVAVTSTTAQRDESPLPFLGREEELAALKGQLGPGRLLLLEGDPGIGKTRLVAELIASESRKDRSMQVVHGAAYELEQGMPYQPIVEALRSVLSRPDRKRAGDISDLAPIWQTELARLLPELLTRHPQIPPPGQPADEARLWEALLQFFQVLSRKHAVWLFLDDLHWADASTIAWLGYLIRHWTSPSLVLVGTTRPLAEQANLGKLLQALRREERLVHIRLRALSRAAMEKMGTALSPQHGGELSGWLIENAEGNPFFLTELVRYARGIGLLAEDGTLDMDLFDSAPIIPATIQNLIASRLLRLSERTRNLLHVAAVVGREFDFELLRQASSISEAEALDAIDELQAAHLIQALRDDRLVFDHSLTMQVALQDMSETRQRSLHRRVAETLESIHETDLDAASGLIARHYTEGRLPERAAAYSFRAGEAASRLAAWVEAIAFYEQALAQETDDARRAPILVAMGSAEFHNGNFAAATEVLKEAVRAAERCRNWPRLEEAHIALNQSLLPQARYAEAIQLARDLRASGPPELALCAEVAWAAGLSVESAHPVEAEQHLHEAERLLQVQPGYTGPITRAQLAYQLAAIVGQQGRSHEAIALYRDALEMTRRGESKLDLLRNIMLRNNLAYHLHLVGDPAAEDTIREAIQFAQQKGSLSHLPFLYSTSGEIALARGDVAAAEKFFHDGLELARRVPVPERIAGLTANLGLAARQRGDPAQARELLSEALLLAQQLGSHHLEVRIRVWLAPLLAREAARACLAEAHTLAERDGLRSLLDEIVGLEQGL